MLKWTLRNPPDAPTPPPPPEVSCRAHEAEARANLKDSNTCWLEAQVKVAQVRSTSKLVENGEGENGKENEGLLQRWRTSHHHHHEEKKRRRRHHKNTRCNPLDPLRLFTGEVTDSDSGSVYMRLEHTPAALLPRPPITPTTGPADPRRKPLIDLSNGDYSDVRKYLQSLSNSSLHHQQHKHYHPPHHHHHHPHHHHHHLYNALHLPAYLQPFARGTEGNVQRGPGPGIPVRPEPLGASSSRLQQEQHQQRPRSLSSSRTRSRSTSVSRSRPPGPSSHSGGAAGCGGQGAGAGVASPLKRHSIADIPSAAGGALRGVWEAQKERRGRSASHERRREDVRPGRDDRDGRGARQETEAREAQHVEGRRGRRERRREEPIYEKVGGESSPSTATNSGSSLASRNSRNSYDNAIYMSMKDLRARCLQVGQEVEEPGDSHLLSPPLPYVSAGPCQTPPREPLYENLLYLPMTELRNSSSKKGPETRPLPAPPALEEHDDTCSFTAEPQRDLHRPVAIRALSGPPHPAVHQAGQPSKKPCDSQGGPAHRSTPEGAAAHRSTGQHVHIDYSEISREPPIPLHHLRPPPPPPPRRAREGQGSKKTRPRAPSWARPEPLLPVIYENTRREEAPRAAKKRKLRHVMEIEFSIDDDDDERPEGGGEPSQASPRGGSLSSSDNPDSGVSEGLTTPLISPLSAPRSPQSPHSDSLLGEACTPLTLEQLGSRGQAAPEDNTATSDTSGQCRLPHDVTDPAFLEGRRHSGLTEELLEEMVSLYRSGGRSCDASPLSRGDVSRMLLSAVGRNLFSDSPVKVSPAREGSLGRRHSLGSLADLSRRMSSLGLVDEASPRRMEAWLPDDTSVKKAQSMLCLSPASAGAGDEANSSSSSVPLMAAVAQILKEPEARGSPPCRCGLPAGGQTAQNTSVQSGQWWAGGAGEEGEGRPATKGSGSAGGQAARPSLSCQSSPRHHQPSCPLGPAPPRPALQTISSNPTLPLPVMSGEQSLAAGHAGADASVPGGPRPEEEALPATQDASEYDSGCGGDLTPRWEQPSARQRRRREESRYRLQRMLQECPCAQHPGEAEESVSADWSMEAVPDEASTRDPCDLEAEVSDALPTPPSLPSPPSPDTASLCTIDSDYGEGLYVSPRLVEQLRRLSEAKMLARLRKSFRSKKEKRPPTENGTTKGQGGPKMGIFMFVDNPMYLSPEVKKEARVVSAHGADDKAKNSWYVGNPMYTSPEPHSRNCGPEERQRALCEKENLRNARLANAVRQNPAGRRPLANLWLQSNPCYESPEAKAPAPDDATYLTPIVPARRSATILKDDPDILDAQKFLDHEYCTIPGDDSDSWVTHSSASRSSDSPTARRTLAFGLPRRDPITPSRIWRETGKNQHSTPCKAQGSLEKGAGLGSRQHRTPRAVKRGRRGAAQEEPRGASPPPLPARPHPPLHKPPKEATVAPCVFEDTSDFHHHRPDARDDTTHFQLPPDGVYESVARGGRRRVARAQSDVSSITSSTYRAARRPTFSSPSPRRTRSPLCSAVPKNGASGSLCEGSQKGRARRRVSSRKYRAGEVLQGKGQLKLAVYENYGLLTIHIMEGRKLKSRLSSVCNPYVKISLVPDSQERTFCRTPLLRATNAPHFDQKFSFDFLPEDLDKRLLVSVWSRDTLRKRSEFLGCMSFNVAHITTKRVHGWFRLLTETLGRRKHFAVSFLNTSQDSSTSSKTKMEEVILLNDNPTPAPARGVAPSEVSSAAPQTQKGAGQTPYTITVVLNRGNQGFGFSVAWTKPPRVERVEAGLPADRAGLQAGDYIIFVSHFNVVKSSEDDVLQMIRECGDVLPLEVYRRGVSKHPRGLANGYTPSAAPLPPLNDNETHARKKLSHIAFNTETTAEDRQSLVFQAINSEQAFSNACRFGVERYLIPLTFRGDLITSTQHQTLFGNMDQLMDLSETLVDSLMGNADEAIGDRVGLAYYQLIEEVVQQYTTYLAGLPEGDQVLALKLQEQDFNEFLHEPPVPRKKPDITAFIHKPAEHLREMLGLLTQVYAASGGHPDNAHLDAVLDRLKSCYRGVTSQQNIMEPSPPTPLPPPTAHHTPPPAARPAAPLRPPLVSVGDIEQRLVFTKFTQPFKLNDGKRQWVFGGELYKFEGRHLKQYWAMLFTDLLLFTKINRDRVIFVMEDPVPLSGVCQAIFNIKKKVTEFRLIVDTSVRVPGSAEAGYLSSPSFTRRRRGSTTSTSSSGRANKRTLVIRAPTIDLKATWNNLINRQLYECQLGGSSPLGDFPASSLGRAASSDGLASHHAASGRFSSSVGDLRRGGSQDGDVLVVDLGQGRARGPPASSSSSTSCFRSRKLQYRNGEVEEELELGDDDDEPQVPGRHASPPLSAPVSPPVNAPRVSLTTAAQPEFQFVVEHDDLRTAPRTTNPSRAAKVKRGKGGGGGRSGGARKRGARTGKVNDRGGGGTDGHEQEIVLSLENEPPRPSVPLLREPSTDSQSALASHRSRTAAEDGALKNKEGEEEYDDEDDEEDDLVIQDIRTGLQSRLNKKKGLGGKVKDKLFPNRHLPRVKKMDRTKKVEKYVDSLMVEDMNHIGRVTPVLPGEENFTQEDFTRTRNHILQSRPKNYQEGAEELIALDSPLSPRRTTTIDQDARRSEMKLEGIDEGARQNLLQTQDSLTGPSAVLSPEDYEDYIGEPVENDYPELAGPSELPTSLTPPASPPPMQAQDSLDYAPQEPAAPEYFQQSEEYYQEEESLPPPAPAPLAVEEPSPSGPLSGSASMNFMDDHSPTNGNGDFYRRCVARCPRQPPRPACGSFSLATSCSPVNTPSASSRGLPRSPPINLLNNNESINSFASHFRTSCVASSDLVSGEKRPKRTVSVSSSSANDSSRNNSTSASEHSSMSISSASSGVSNVNKNRTRLFLPTSTTSLPEISVEPPTPQAPKPKDAIDRENKIKYDLLVPGYRSMFLTVPGMEDDCSDRFLPKYSLDSDDDDEDSSSDDDDDDVVHKPKVLGSLTGLAEGRGLKRYGSSCDIAKLVKGVPEDTLYGQDDYCDDDYNGNFDANQKVSKVGGTGSGPFVAGKLAMFEKVVEEEHQKFIEGQEVRKRIFRAPRKSGEYIEKFYSPKVISNVDARAVERCQSPYYEDEYDNLDRSRPCTPRDIETPYGGHSSPRLRTSDSSNVYISKPASPSPRHASPQTKFYGHRSPSPSPRSPSPTPRSPSPSPRSLSPPIFKCPPPLARSSPPRARSPSPVARSPSPLAVSNNYQYDNESYPERPMSPSSTQYKADTRQVTPVPGSSAGGRRMSPNPTRSQPFCYQESLEQRTDEALEMLDMSYLDDAAPPPSRYTPTAAASPPPARGQEKIRRGCSTSPPPPAPPVDPLDDVFEIEEEDVTGSTSSIGGRNKRAAPRPPTPPHGAAASPPAEGKLGAFFKGRLGKDSSAPKEKKEKKKKDVDKKGKDKKEKEKKEKEKKEEKGGGAGGKRFQLFGGTKKSSEPHTPPPDSPAASPKKDEKEKGAGKRRLFGRGKENFLGRSSQVNQTSDPQVARMSGGSFDDSINLDDEFM
ncbi:uncharacterized protein LOC126988248 isoform X2 [Eriocheir sinensis]|uniref:uncharacterized protein LOC126988248 isoform X2 n=1 Tax=Eriocheir sinensis TaxID=95602 RepID=UPI0021C920A3|nr:uncharacterized protein LOC126988248 isoform X2 [Eriocheir sinensis]